MKFNDVIGIDVSRDTIDVCIHSMKIFEKLENTNVGFRKLITWVKKHTDTPLNQVLFCFEHTGLYSSLLAGFLAEKQYCFTIVPGLEIKRSLGIQRGKDDKVDAEKIALYAYRRRDEIKPYNLPDQSMVKIKHLLSLRDKIVRQRAGYQATLKEQSSFIKKSEGKLLFSIPIKLIKELDKQIDLIEAEIDMILEENRQLKKLYELIISIKGVGRQTALHILVITNGFLLFENSRKLASYAGIAPFPHSSGTSIKGKNKVSNLANKKLKSLLSSCASTAIQHDPELKMYYKRKIEEGKNTMQVKNAVRNKLVHRIFAVVRRGTPYVNTHKFAA
jgi:transposase